jgi:hypothetical protein
VLFGFMTGLSIIRGDSIIADHLLEIRRRAKGIEISFSAADNPFVRRRARQSKPTAASPLAWTKVAPPDGRGCGASWNTSSPKARNRNLLRIFLQSSQSNS